MAILLTIIDHYDWQKLLRLSKKIKEKVIPYLESSKIAKSWKLAEYYHNKNKARFEYSDKANGYCVYGYFWTEPRGVPIGCCIGACGCGYRLKMNVIDGRRHGPLTEIDHGGCLVEHSHFNKGACTLRYHIDAEVGKGKDTIQTIVYRQASPDLQKKINTSPIKIERLFTSHKNWSPDECPICEMLRKVLGL